MQNWREQEIKILMENIGKVQISRIAELTGRTENAVRIYCMRHDIPVRQQIKFPMMRLLLDIKFGSSEFFKPSRQWLAEVRISQKRFSSLRQGYEQATEEEMKRVAKKLNVSHEELITLCNSRQLDLF